MKNHPQFLSLPPKYAQRDLLGRLVFPMSEEAAQEWLKSYDRWVDLWNKHEQDWNLPLSPDWEDATYLNQFAVRSALCFRPEQSRTRLTLPLESYVAVIRMKGFRHFPGRTLAAIRGKAKPDRIIWGAWGIRCRERPEKLTAEDFIEPRL